MAKFKFYEDRKITAWTRDYFEVEAESLEDAIALIEKHNCGLDELEGKHMVANWLYRDGDVMWDTIEETDTFGIYSCDLENNGEIDCEIIAH